MGNRALPDMYALSPRASGIHIRPSTRAHVITYTCLPVKKVKTLCTLVSLQMESGADLGFVEGGSD